MVTIKIPCLAALVGVIVLVSVQSTRSEIGTVSFAAGLAVNRRYKTGEKLIFNIDVVNLGDGYNSATGIFTAPERGIYKFGVLVASVEVYIGTTYSACLYHNGKRILLIEVNIQALIESLPLEQGDTVYVEALRDMSPADGIFTGSQVLSVITDGSTN